MKLRVLMWSIMRRRRGQSVIHGSRVLAPLITPQPEFVSSPKQNARPSKLS
jgi:hypothetical protein